MRYSKGDDRILSLTARDVVAAEAHYHASCYKLYTKVSSKDDVQGGSTSQELPDAYKQAPSLPTNGRNPNTREHSKNEDCSLQLERNATRLHHQAMKKSKNCTALMKKLTEDFSSMHHMLQRMAMRLRSSCRKTLMFLSWAWQLKIRLAFISFSGLE